MQEILLARIAPIALTLALLTGTSTIALARARPFAPNPRHRLPARQPDHEQDWRPQAQLLLTKAQGFMHRPRQHESGGWGIHDGTPTFPAITALTVIGFLDGPKGAISSVDPADPAMQKALDFLLSKQQPNGGVYDQVLPTYNSTICLSAGPHPLPRRPPKTPRTRFPEVSPHAPVERPRESPADMTDAAKAIGKDHSSYGGVGYGRHGRPDLSNTAFFVEALHRGR